MGLPIKDRIAHAWNAFTSREDDSYSYVSSYDSGGRRQSRDRYSSERSILASILNRISLDFAAVEMLHVRVDENGRYAEEIDSGLNYCLNTEANIDQVARAFKQDIALSLCEVGTMAIVPIETSLNPNQTSGYDIKNMRVGTIVQWYPKAVRVRVYDERTGEKREIVLPKTTVAVAENPFYTVMNEQNSTLQRLIRKLNYLDAIDKASSSGKLDIIIQLPYVIKNEAKQAAAEKRRKDIEMQLQGSQYGIAYTDATEKITQLNRAAENNLLTQVQYLVEQLYAELGLTKEIMNGSADEKTMLNYYNRTIEPILAVVAQAMSRTFLSKTARTQKQTIMYFRDPFSLVPINNIADIADKFTRNEILTSNEVRSLIGFKPSKDPNADELRNKNIPEPTPTVETEQTAQTDGTENKMVSTKESEGDSQNGS